MNNPITSGICTALVTPFLDDKVNIPLMKQLLHRQIEAGVTAVVLSGTTGESPTLSDSEKFQLFRSAKDFVGNSCTIIAGTGTNSTKHAVALSQLAVEAGADALLVVSPYYNKGNSDGLITHYLTIAQAVDVPVILYNVPSRTGIDVPISVYQELALQRNIIGVKEASTDITKVTRIKSTCGNDFQIWTGNDDQIVPAISLGAKGAISVISNIFPNEAVALTQAALAGDFDTAARLQRKLMPLIDLLFSEVNPIPVKYAMQHIGFDCGDCRLPLGRLNLKNKQRLDAYFT